LYRIILLRFHQCVIISVSLISLSSCAFSCFQKWY
jgi:hypothetical protein